MSTLSASEKRKLLRERRQQKFSNGGASNRLNKITGQQSNSFLSNDSPLDQVSVEKSDEMKLGLGELRDNESSSVERSTKQMEELLSTLSEPHANQDAQPSNPELALFQQLLKAQQNASGLEPGSVGASTPDLFGSLLSETKAATSAANMSADAIFADQSTVTYYNFQVARVKSYITLLKWVILIPLIFAVLHPNPDLLLHSRLSLLTDKSNFFMIFTSLEVTFISIYYQVLTNLQRKLNLSASQNIGGMFKYLTMIPEGILPVNNLQSKIALIARYMDVISMYVTDISFVIVLLGLMKYYHSF